MDSAVLVALAGDVILLFTMLVFTYQAQQMAKQSRESAAATRASVYQAITEQMLNIDRLFITNPELRPYVYEGAALPAEEPLRTQVLALAELFVDFFDNFVTQSGQIPPQLYEPWRRYARSVMQSSPAACAFWNENREWYSELLQEMLDPYSSAGDNSSVQAESAKEWANTGELVAD
jgi:hypothetical protein